MNSVPKGGVMSKAKASPGPGMLTTAPGSIRLSGGKGVRPDQPHDAVGVDVIDLEPCLLVDRDEDDHLLALAIDGARPPLRADRYFERALPRVGGEAADTRGGGGRGGGGVDGYVRGMADLGKLEVEGAYKHAVGEAGQLEPGPDDPALDVVAPREEGVDAVVLEKVAVDRRERPGPSRRPRIC